jgi:hypothetical protein
MKVDFKKDIPSYRARRGAFEVVEVPPLQYPMVDGHGDPNVVEEYAEAVSAIYTVAYRLKFFSKKQLDRDYAVMPLEGLWWSDDMDSFTSARDKSQWDWTMLNMVPDWITREHFEQALAAAATKDDAPRGLAKLRLETYAEGTSVQTLHVGSFDDEAPVLAVLHDEVIPSRGLRMTGKHHEIYLSDPRRTAPAKLRTILRQPVESGAVG